MVGSFHKHSVPDSAPDIEDTEIDYTHSVHKDSQFEWRLQIYKLMVIGEEEQRKAQRTSLPQGRGNQGGQQGGGDSKVSLFGKICQVRTQRRKR